MKVPPLAQLAICFAIAGGLATYMPILRFHAPSWLVAIEITAGTAFLVPAVVSFIRHKTTVNPQSPSNATSLVTSGVFSISRNPMYVGMLLLLLAFVLWLGEVSALFAAVVFFISIDQFQIKSEEQSLREKFGEAFTKYAKHVPRWLIIRNG